MSAPLLNFLLFADDTSIYLSGKNMTSLYQTVNSELESINEWMSANYLILNVNKTKCMLFSTVSRNTNLSLMYSNKNIEMVHNVKFLGININEKLSWNYHVSQLCNTIARNVGVLSTLQFLPENVLKMSYHTLISSHLIYCLSIWGLTSNVILPVSMCYRKKLCE